MVRMIRDRSRYLAVVVCDPDNAATAGDLAGKVGLPLWHMGRGSDIVPAEVEQVIVDVNLRNTQSAEMLRGFLAQLPAGLPRHFIVDNGEVTRLSRVQANALGATHHVSRHTAVAVLRQLLSSMADLSDPIPDSRQAAILAAAGGGSVLAAGRSIATLFDGLVGDRLLPPDIISSASASVIADVGAIGGEAWLDTVRAHHEGTFQHCLLVTGVAASYATGSGLSQVAASALVSAALVHDVGKAVIPRQILDKPGKLTEAEFAVVKRHPDAGYEYLKDRARLPPVVLAAVRHHHEFLDGSGYPLGLKGDEVLPLTRILTVCDIFAAMVEARAYKAPSTPSEAVARLVEMALGSKVDYAVVRRLALGFRVRLPETLHELATSLLHPADRARPMRA